MFDFFKKKSKNLIVADEEVEDENVSVITGVGIAATDSARSSMKKVKQTFAKPDKYDRHLYDSGSAKRNAKVEAFKDSATVLDPYTGCDLVMTKSEAKMKYGKDWASHLAETDHKVSEAKGYEKTRNNAWTKTEDVKEALNHKDNLEVVSRKINNAKRKRSGKEFYGDEEYLKKTGVELSESSKDLGVKTYNKAERKFDSKIRKSALKNMSKTGHDAGLDAGKESGLLGLSISSINNLYQVIKGEKNVSEALADTAKDGGKSALAGYAMGGGMTVFQHTLSNSSSKFLQGLANSSVPGKVITAVMVTGDTLRKYGNGDITLEECIVELGEKGVGMVASCYSMMLGQALIPIPVVGAAVGAFVGSALTSQLYNELITILKTRELEHQERLRIIAECERLVEEERHYRAELECYLESYFKEYKDCFDEALVDIKISFNTDDPDGVIAGANKITQKLGGNIYYENVSEFKEFLLSCETDVL